MINMNYDEILARIQENSEHSKTDLEGMVEKKLKQLSGLISREGAAHIVANQLGIKLVEKTSGKLQIKNILAGMRDVELVAKVLRIYPTRRFTTNGRKGQVASLLVGDETGTIRVVLWGDHADQSPNIKEDKIIKVKSGYVKENNNYKEVHLGGRSHLILNPKGETIGEVQASAQQAIRPQSTRKKLNELKEGDDNIEILGTIVQVFDPRFYEVCPKCNKKPAQKDGVFVCEQHGEVTPNFAYVINLFLDDGTENMRIVCFRNQALNLLGLEDEAMQKFRAAPEEFESVKTELLGNIVKIAGRVVKNQMFERLEFMARFVTANPNPEEEIKQLDKEIEAVKATTPSSTTKTN